MERMLPSEEAARRLGVKVTTLYAYVSRGLLESHPEPGGRRSLFDLADIERMAARSRGGNQTGSRLATITTGVTQLREDEGPTYRGHPAPGLVGRMTFEEVAALLWECEVEGDWTAPALGPSPLELASDRMRWALVMCAANDPLRADVRPEAIVRAARRVIAALVDVVGPARAGEDARTPIAHRLAQRLHGDGASLSAAAVDAALILMADHELATSTVAVRIAASTRADLYDALLAGLATMAGPLHGGASQQAYELLVAAERDGASRALNDSLRWQRAVPGFGHLIYKVRDPRFDALLALAEPLLSADRRRLLRQLLELAADHHIPVPNCDLALAALSWGTGMPPDAGRTIFTLARLAGWTAHYQEELTERPLRFRARAVYSV
jgi:citrate synthase